MKSRDNYGDSSQSHGNASSEEENVADREDIIKTTKTPRKRLNYSCTECQRRKQKCNRVVPCRSCVARNVPEQCRMAEDARREPSRIETRLKKLERTMQDKLDAITQKMDSREHSSSLASTSVAEEENSVSYFAPSQSVNLSLNTYFESLHGTRSAGVLSDPVTAIEGATELDALMYEYGAVESMTMALISVLPSRNIADALVQHYFDEVNWLRQPQSYAHFLSRYTLFWQSGPSLAASNINDYALIVIVMAISSFTIERPDLFSSHDPQAVRLRARRLFFAGRRALLVSTMLGRDDAQQVVAYCLASRFLLLDGRVTEAWTCAANAVKTAQAIGLHRDGSKSANITAQETEMRRRVWVAIYSIDRHLCLNLGRPTLIDDQVVDTEMPSEAVSDYAEYTDLYRRNGKPIGSSSPTPFSYTIQRHRLAVIMGKIASVYQRLHNTTSHYRSIIELDKQLDAFRKDLPDFFRSDVGKKDGKLFHVNTRFDNDFPFVPIHRYLIEVDVDHVKVALHQHYLLRTRTGVKEDRYEFSRKACINAAHHSILLRNNVFSFLTEKFGVGKIPKSLRLHLGTEKQLNSLIIIGMYLLESPEAENSAALLGHLRAYVEEYEGKKKVKGDPIKDREADIIQMFLDRIEGSEKGEKGFRKRIRRDTKSQPNDQGQQKRIKEEKREDNYSKVEDSVENVSISDKTIPSFYSAPSDGIQQQLWPYFSFPTHQGSAPPASNSYSSSSLGVDEVSPQTTLPTSEEGSSSPTEYTTAQDLFEAWFRHSSLEATTFDSVIPTFSTTSSFSSPSSSGNQPLQTFGTMQYADLMPTSRPTVSVSSNSNSLYLGNNGIKSWTALSIPSVRHEALQETRNGQEQSMAINYNNDQHYNTSSNSSMAQNAPFLENYSLRPEKISQQPIDDVAFDQAFWQK